MGHVLPKYALLHRFEKHFGTSYQWNPPPKLQGMNGCTLVSLWTGQGIYDAHQQCYQNTTMSDKSRVLLHAVRTRSSASFHLRKARYTSASDCWRMESVGPLGAMATGLVLNASNHTYKMFSLSSTDVVVRNICHFWGCLCNAVHSSLVTKHVTERNIKQGILVLVEVNCSLFCFALHKNCQQNITKQAKFQYLMYNTNHTVY